MQEDLRPGGANTPDRTIRDLAELVRSWRNHWAEVERITADFPEDIRRVLALRPTDPAEALEQTRAQFAVLFNPAATAVLVERLDSVLETLERLADETRER